VWALGVQELKSLAAAGRVEAGGGAALVCVVCSRFSRGVAARHACRAKISCGVLEALVTFTFRCLLGRAETAKFLGCRGPRQRACGRTAGVLVVLGTAPLHCYALHPPQETHNDIERNKLEKSVGPAAPHVQVHTHDPIPSASVTPSPPRRAATAA
jgi:hypothetical protein